MLYKATTTIQDYNITAAVRLIGSFVYIGRAAAGGAARGRPGSGRRGGREVARGWPRREPGGGGQAGARGRAGGNGSAEFPQNLANIPYGVAIFTKLSSKTGL